MHLDNSDDWSLQVRYPQTKDAGVYECQLSTMPKRSIFVSLNVVSKSHAVYTVLCSTLVIAMAAPSLH